MKQKLQSEYMWMRLKVMYHNTSLSVRPAEQSFLLNITSSGIEWDHANSSLLNSNLRSVSNQQQNTNNSFRGTIRSFNCILK